MSHVHCIDLFEVGEKLYPVNGYAKEETGREIPIVDSPMMSDYDWQCSCLESRLRHPEAYAPYEDVEAKIAKLRAWLEEHAPMREEAPA